jgi:hypothetical protein
MKEETKKRRELEKRIREFRIQRKFEIPIRQADYASIYWHARMNAAKRKIEFDLTQSEFERLVKRARGRCMLSGIEFEFKCSSGKKRPFAPSLDRIDSSKGYAVENCRLICVIANYALNQWGDVPLIRFVEKMHEKIKRDAGLKRRKAKKVNAPEIENQAQVVDFGVETCSPVPVTDAPERVRTFGLSLRS